MEHYISGNAQGLPQFLPRGAWTLTAPASPSGSNVRSFLSLRFLSWPRSKSPHPSTVSGTLINREEAPCCRASFWKDFGSMNLMTATLPPQVWPVPHLQVGTDRRGCVLETLKYQWPFFTELSGIF